jgi:AraC-like DNA-binding protein
MDVNAKNTEVDSVEPKQGRNIFKYLSINNDEISSYVAVSGVGFQQVEPGEDYPAKGHPTGYAFNPESGRTLNEYAVVYVTRGEGVFNSLSSGEQKIDQGSIIFIHPEQWHTYSPDKNIGWDEYWITFKGSYFDWFYKTFVDESNPVLYLGFEDRIVRLFQEMLACAQFQQIGFQQILSGIAIHILGLVNSISRSQTFESQEVQRIKEACVIMRENILNKLSAIEIASSLNMSYSNFRKLFKQYTNMSPHQYMLQLKIEKIKDLLGSTDLSIQDIADTLNFESADYFSYFFRCKTGINPRLFRQKIEKQRKAAKKNTDR